MADCKCNMREKFVGDGCDVCNPAKALEYARGQLDEVRTALSGYYAALDRREHGGVAMSKALHEVEEAMGMHWERGASLRPNAALTGASRNGEASG